MSSPLLSRSLSLLQQVIFQQIGGTFHTNAMKGVMDRGFVLFEKIGCKFPVLIDLYLDFYRDVVRKEMALAGLSRQDILLIIGSGSLPATPLLAAELTDASIVSIDRDRSAVRAATAVIRKRGMEDRVSIVHGDGLTYPADSFTCVYIMYGVRQPQKILSSLPSRTCSSCRFIFRTITDPSGAILDKTLSLDQYTVKDKVHTTTLGSFTSFLLEKKA